MHGVHPRVLSMSHHGHVYLHTVCSFASRLCTALYMHVCQIYDRCRDVRVESTTLHRESFGNMHAINVLNKHDFGSSI